MGSQEPDDPHAMVLHHFGSITFMNRSNEVEGSWKPESERVIVPEVPTEFHSEFLKLELE